jgi:hypothetical protein
MRFAGNAEGSAGRQLVEREVVGGGIVGVVVAQLFVELFL